MRNYYIYELKGNKKLMPAPFIPAWPVKVDNGTQKIKVYLSLRCMFAQEHFEEAYKIPKRNIKHYIYEINDGKDQANWLVQFHPLALKTAFLLKKKESINQLLNKHDHCHKSVWLKY